MGLTTSLVSPLATSSSSSAFHFDLEFDVCDAYITPCSYLNANGGTDPNSAIGDAGAALLIANITDTRTVIDAMKLSKTLPIGTADAGAYFNTEVLEAVDYGMSNIHAWFANVSINDAAAWVNEFFQENNIAAADALSNKPAFYIAETGWPTVRFDPQCRLDCPG